MRRRREHRTRTVLRWNQPAGHSPRAPLLATGSAGTTEYPVAAGESRPDRSAPDAAVQESSGRADVPLADSQKPSAAMAPRLRPCCHRLELVRPLPQPKIGGGSVRRAEAKADLCRT